MTILALSGKNLKFPKKIKILDIITSGKSIHQKDNIQ